jgi:hypothetical protein
MSEQIRAWVSEISDQVSTEDSLLKHKDFTLQKFLNKSSTPYLRRIESMAYFI